MSWFVLAYGAVVIAVIVLFGAVMFASMKDHQDYMRKKRRDK